VEAGWAALALPVLSRGLCETESRRAVSSSGLVPGIVVYRMKNVFASRFAVLLSVGIVLLVLPCGWAATLLPPPTVNAMPITLAWDSANDPGVSGYALYYGATNQPTFNRVDAGTNLTVTLFDLRADTGYKLFVVAYNAVGLESVPSNELLLTPPAISRLQLARQANGSLRLSGKAAPGTVCTLQFTSTLQPALWQTLTRTTADQVGSIIAFDASVSKVSRRFYRLALGALPLLGRMQIQRRPDGSMLLSGKAPPGAACRVQYASTPNPTAWSTLRTVAADAEGNVVTVDTGARLAPRRFYRMALP